MFRDWLRDEGIDPPDPVPGDRSGRRTARAWADWWELVEGGLFTPAQTAHVWEGLDKVRYFEVAEVPAADPGGRFAVVHVGWEYDDCWYCGGNDAVAVYPTRREAEAAARAVRVERGARGGYPNGGPNEVVVVELPAAGEGG